MTKRLSIVIALVFLACASLPAGVGAHGGHDQEEEKVQEAEETPSEPTAYSIDDGDEGSLFDSSLSGLSDDEDMMGSDMPMPMGEMDHGQGDHKQHEMDIEKATHTRIHSSAKGYGVAIAITILSGLIFGFLHFKRPNE